MPKKIPSLSCVPHCSASRGSIAHSRDGIWGICSGMQLREELSKNYKSGGYSSRDSRILGGCTHKSNDPGDLQVTPLWLLTCIAVVVAAVCFFALDIWLRAGRSPLSVPIVSFVVPVALGAFVLWQGSRVRAYQRGVRTLNPLEAARIFLLTQAGSRAGAVLVGTSLGAILAYGHTGQSGFMAEQMFHLACAALGSFALVICSYIAERWCVIRDEDEGSAPQVRPESGSAAAAARSNRSMNQ